MRRRLRSGRGQSLAEFAIVAPLFFITVFGIVDFARMVQSYVTMQHSAREGVRYAVTGRSDCDTASPTRMTCIDFITRAHTQNLAHQSTIQVKVRSWQFQSGGYAATPTENSAGVQCDDVEVEVDYEYTPMTPVIGRLIGTVPLHAKERLVNEPYGPCGT